MYDKHGRVLRIETVINQPREFKVRRQGVRQGREVIDWFPLCKGVANLFRYAEICRAANRRHLDALAAVEPPVGAMRGLRHLARSRRRNGRPRPSPPSGKQGEPSSSTSARTWSVGEDPPQPPLATDRAGQSVDQRVPEMPLRKVP